MCQVFLQSHSCAHALSHDVKLEIHLPRWALHMYGFPFILLAVIFTCMKTQKEFMVKSLQNFYVDPTCLSLQIFHVDPTCLSLQISMWIDPTCFPLQTFHVDPTWLSLQIFYMDSITNLPLGSNMDILTGFLHESNMDILTGFPCGSNMARLSLQVCYRL